MLQKAKEGLFFFAAFMVIVWLLSFLAPRPVGATPQADWQVLAAPYLPGLIAITKGVAIAMVVTIAGVALCFVLVPFRDWLIRKQQLGAEEHRRKMLHVPINDYTRSAADSSRLLELRNLRKDHQLLYSRVAAICSKHLGGKRPATIHGLLNELEFVIAQLQEQSAAPSQAAPSGPNWRAIAGLVGSLRNEPKPRLRATRDAFRAAGVSIPEVDAKTGGKFWEWVWLMGMDDAPSPTAPSVSVGDDSTLADADDTTADGRNEATDALPVGEGRSDKAARFIIPRIARKRKGERW